MTADDLIALLQAFTPEQRQREVWMEADAGYASVGSVDVSPHDEAVIICPEEREGL